MTVIERDTAHGALRFEDLAPGEWLTKTGVPASKRKRQYTLDGEPFDAVSSIVDTLSKPALVDWAGDTSAVAAAIAAQRGDLDGIHPDDVPRVLADLGLGHRAGREEGAARGTAVHVAFEAMADGGLPQVADHPDEWRPYMTGAARAWRALNATPVDSERIVCHPEHRYAGRLDLLAETHRGLTLVDYKSARGGKVFPEAHYQTRLYEMALAAEDVRVDAIVIVAVGSDAGVEFIDCEATEDDALALLRTFRSRKRINAGMAAQRKAARAALKAAA